MGKCASFCERAKAAGNAFGSFGGGFVYIGKAVRKRQQLFHNSCENDPHGKCKNEENNNQRKQRRGEARQAQSAEKQEQRLCDKRKQAADDERQKKSEQIGEHKQNSRRSRGKKHKAAANIFNLFK